MTTFMGAVFKQFPSNPVRERQGRILHGLIVVPEKNKHSDKLAGTQLALASNPRARGQLMVTVNLEHEP